MTILQIIVTHSNTQNFMYTCLVFIPRMFVSSKYLFCPLLLFSVRNNWYPNNFYYFVLIKPHQYHFYACCDFMKQWLRTYLRNLCVFLKVPPHTVSALRCCIIVYSMCYSMHTTQTRMVEVLSYCMRIIIITFCVVMCSISEWFLLFYSMYVCMWSISYEFSTCLRITSDILRRWSYYVCVSQLKNATRYIQTFTLYTDTITTTHIYDGM